jgi:hypothetical protein
MTKFGNTDSETTVSYDNSGQHSQTDASHPTGKISALVYDFLKLPNPYHYNPSAFIEPTQNMYSILGAFHPSSVESVMEHVVCCLRAHAQSDRPYTFGEFKHLLKKGTLIENAPDKSDPELYRHDSELSTMRLENPLYALRKAFIYRQSYRHYQNQQQDEKILLSRFGKTIGTHQEDYQTYLAYLKADYSEALAPFFREWRLPVSEFDRERHTIITAKTGYGKSELIKLAIHRDIRRTRRPGVILLEPHGELSESVARFRENIGSDRLIYIDPTLHPDYTPVINPLDVYDKSPTGIDRATEELVEVFRIVLSGNSSPFTPNMETILLACISTLILKGDATLFDLLDFMDDDKNMALVAFGANRLANPTHHYLFTHDFRGDKYEITKAAIKTKLYSFLSSSTLHNFLIGKSTINIKEAMDSGKLIIVCLPKHLGPRSIEIIGRFFTASVQNIAFERSKIPEKQRKKVHMYIDESHRFISPVIEGILTDARKYKVFMTFSMQILGQDADTQLKRIISSCTNVKITGANDFKSLSAISKETGLEVDEMRDLRVGEFYVKAGSGLNIKFKAPSYLREESSFMTAQEWEQTKAEQLAKYYRKIDRTGHSKPDAEKTGRKPGSPIET